MRSANLPALIVLALGASLSLAVVAGEGEGTASDELRPAARSFDRQALAEIILGTWAPQMGSESIDGRDWHVALGQILDQADEHNLRRAADALDYDQMLAIVSGAPMSADVTKDGNQILALGDLNEDLVYTPIVPCRIFDSRFATNHSGNPIPANSSRNFDARPFGGGTFAFQGGDASQCGIPADPAAVVINVTSVNPVGAGFLTVYPYLAEMPLAATITYASGSIVSNEVVSNINTPGLWSISIYSYRTTHVVGDAVGYFRRPTAAAMDCDRTEIDVAVAAGTRELRNLNCPVGYTAMSGGAMGNPSNAGLRVESSSPNRFVDDNRGWFISVANDTGGLINMKAHALCCRMPGN